MKKVAIGGNPVTYRDIAAIALGHARLTISDQAAWRDAMHRSRVAVEARLASDQPLYGVKTGFGASCTQEVSAAMAQELATNLYRYHGAGVGDRLTEAEGAAVLATRLAQLGAGYSGVRVATLEALARLLEARIIPCIPELGSVGASGDLTPMSYVAAALEGDREVYYQGRVVPTLEALEAIGAAPWRLLPKESLSLMNGTSVMTALVSLSMVRIAQFARAHAGVTAWVSWLMGGAGQPFR